MEFTPKQQQIIADTIARKKLELYRPYPKQQLFHKEGKNFRERLLRAGNQMGKTLSAAAETAIHATGKYPDWWEGRRFMLAPSIWAGGITGEVTRDTVQKLLIGDVAHPGSGFIPSEDIIETVPSRGVAGLIDTILVKHVSGGTTRLRLKYYEQGREKWQGDTVHVVWFDEEPDMDIYTEGLTRTNATRGIVYMTFTPLKGMSDVVRRFLENTSADKIDINMTIDDALHIPKAERERIIDSYPPHEKEARIYGTPSLGGGRIFPVSEELISVRAFDPQSKPWFWQEIAAIDFGWDHPTAAVKLLYDTQGDIVYVTNVYKRREATPLVHAAALKPWGRELQWAWPHDGLQHDKGSGVQLSELYRQQGLKMLYEHAKYPDDRGNGVEAGIADMLMRMETGKFKVFSHLTEFFEEFRLYHRKEGKVVKEFDDIMSACRYAIMSLNFAQPQCPPASAPNGVNGYFKSNYNPLDRNYIAKYLTERR